MESEGGQQVLSTPRADRPAVAIAEKSGVQLKSFDKKLADLKASRRAQGLCDHCGEKWSRDHKCASQVGLNVLDEVYDIFSSVAAADCPPLDDDSPESVCLCLSADGDSVAPSIKTLHFHGLMQQCSVMILLDSGSSTSFINKSLVNQLDIPTVQCPPLSICIADGNLMQYSTMVPSASWSMNGYLFQHDLEILPLHSYDIILGMDWFQVFSPMKIDWRQRWLTIPY